MIDNGINSSTDFVSESFVAFELPTKASNASSLLVFDDEVIFQFFAAALITGLSYFLFGECAGKAYTGRR